MIASIRRTIRAAWVGFFRDGGLVVANVLILALTISVISSLYLFNEVSKFVIAEVQNKVDISVYFTEETSEDDILKVKDQIAQIPEVSEVEYVSKDEALVNFVERHKNDSVLMNALEEVVINPFLGALNVKAKEASQYGAIASFLESANLESVKKIDYYERAPVVEKIFTITSNFKMAGIFASILLTIIAILVAFNAVRLSIYNSREEIKIQRLVGASNWFVRGPFLAQGAMVGVFASIAAFFFVFALSWILNAKFAILFYGLDLVSLLTANLWYFFLMQLIIGVVLGTASSFVAVKKHLKV